MENKLLNALKEFLKSRKVTFRNGILFYLYLFFVIFIIGGAGIWASLFIEICNDSFLHQNIYLSIMTFSLPLVTTFAIDIIKMDVDKQIKTILQIILFASVIICIVVFTVFAFSRNNWAYLPAIIFAFLALFFWWIVSCENKNLYDEDYYTKNRKSEQSLEQTLNSL
jgi:hypothetical protein